MVIAIDGPAGAGKSTVARAVAQRLGFTYLDTGAMYRCVGLAAQDSDDAPGVVAQRARIEFEDGHVRLDGRDVTEAIRRAGVSDAASRVAADPEVRKALVAKQQQIVANGNWVAEGRDIGTVVAPDAAVKVFLYADPAVRAERRASQLNLDVADVLAKQKIRDERDNTEGRSTLSAPEGSDTVDTTHLTLDEVVDAIVQLAEARR
jgi:cytidylate kinase